MQLSRRLFVGAFGAFGLSSLKAWGQDSDDYFLPSDLIAQIDGAPFYEIEDTEDVGTAPATSDEELIATSILDTAPTEVAPVLVAKYFLEVAQGWHGHEKRKFATAWPVRWNPVIRAFFSETNFGIPKSDLVPWCAAFVNWTITKANFELPDGEILQGTNSAASKSFRNWRQPRGEGSAKLGDVVVFENVKRPQYGHVGFYINEDDTHVEVLGGNQFRYRTENGKSVRLHTVSIKKLPKNGTVLKLHSIRGV